jgi:TonB-dependent SusC/RagA subfamily outer membrane receptor
VIILDGEPSTLEEIRALDPGTIESIEVIKGPAARSLYGDGAEVGVVLVTTRVSPASR